MSINTRELPEKLCRCKNCPAQEKLQALQEQAKALERENLRLKLELQEFRERYWLGKKKKKLEQDQAQPQVSSKKQGPPFGHPGWFRKKPKRKPDYLEDVILKKCPRCNSRVITELKEDTIEEHTQEDIEFETRITMSLYRHHYYWCKRCKDVVSGVGQGELVGSFIGPNAKALACWFKNDVKVSDRDLKRILEKLFKLKLSSGSFAGFRNQFFRRSQGFYEALKARLRRSREAYVDETGWKVDGDRHQLWSGSNKKLSVFSIHKSRGAKALKELLGERFGGALVSDFLSTYERYEAKFKQKCNIHLVRELNRILKNWKEDLPTQRYCQRLKALIQEALQIKKDFKEGRLSRRSFRKKRNLIVSEISDFEICPADRKPLARIANRLAKYKGELFTFLDQPGLEGHNNQAEREIRPNVLLRKITFGNRSMQGAKNHSLTMSVIQTAKRNGLSPPEVLQKLWMTPPEKQSLSLVGL